MSFEVTAAPTSSVAILDVRGLRTGLTYVANGDNTGTISGTPATVRKTTSYHLSVTDVLGKVTVKQSLTLTVTPGIEGSATCGSGRHPAVGESGGQHRKARSTSATRSSLSSRAQQANAAMAAPSAGPGHGLGAEIVGRAPESVRLRTRPPPAHHSSYRTAEWATSVGHGADQDHPDAQLVELAGPEPVGGHHRAAQDVHQRLVVRGFGQAVAQPDQFGVELPPHHVRLGLEVAEEGAAARSRRPRRSRPPWSRRSPAGRTGRGRPGPRPAATCSPAGRLAAPTGGRLARPHPVAVRHHFHFGIECTKLHPSTRSGLRRPTTGGPMTVATTEETTPTSRRRRPDAGPTPCVDPAGRGATCWSRTSPSTACAASTRPPHRPDRASHDRCHPDGRRRRRAPSTVRRPWALHPQVALRPESFGALAYHFGTRRLSFLKSRTLLTVVESLAEQPTGRMPAAPPASPTTSSTLRAGPGHPGRVGHDLRAGAT